MRERNETLKIKKKLKEDEIKEAKDVRKMQSAKRKQAWE